MNGFDQQDLFDGMADSAGLPLSLTGLPLDCTPKPIKHFEVERIVLSRGSLDTPTRRGFVERICALYPNAERIEWLSVPHNRVALEESAPDALHRKGKRTLVFGELKSAVRRSDEENNTCPNYRHFSVLGFCPYDCRYCYLAGTQGVWFSPTVKIYVNLPEIISEIDLVANRLARPTAFYHGKLQDGLALDPLTGYMSVLVPFFARHRYARQVLLTKSDEVGHMLHLDHCGHTILSWSLNPPSVAEAFETNAPSIPERLVAMERCAEAGFPVRAVIMPIIPVEGWEKLYADFLEELLGRVPIQRLTLGGICIYSQARSLMEMRIGRDNVISRHLERPGRVLRDGRKRYGPDLRVRMYAHLASIARRIRPDLAPALCLEEENVWHKVGLSSALGRCNCVL